MRARDRREVVEADLDPDRAPAALVRGEARAQLTGHRAQRIAQPRWIVDVLVEGPLARLRDDLALRADDPVVFEARATSQFESKIRAEALDEHPLGRGADGGERGEPQRRQARRGLRPDPGHQSRRGLGEARARLLAREHDEARRLLRVGGDLGDELVRPDADRADQLRGRPDLREQPAHRRSRRVQARQIEVGLVEAHHLDSIDVRAHEVHHLAGDLPVGRKVGRQHDRLRAQPPRPRGRHRRADTEAPGLVAGGRDDRARTAARDDHGLALQLGVATQLDRDVEGVRVQMRHSQLGDCVD